jgi:hypothetical protein
MQVWECRPPDVGSKDRVVVATVGDEDAWDGDPEAEVGALDGVPVVLGAAEGEWRGRWWDAVGVGELEHADSSRASDTTAAASGAVRSDPCLM